MGIEPLVNRAPGVFGHRLRTARLRRPCDRTGRRRRGTVNGGGGARSRGGGGARSAGRGAGRTGRTLLGIFSDSCSSRRPRPTAASRRSRPPLRFSGWLLLGRFAALGAQLVLAGQREFVDPRHPRRPAGGTLRRRRDEVARRGLRAGGGASLREQRGLGLHRTDGDVLVAAHRQERGRDRRLGGGLDGFRGRVRVARREPAASAGPCGVSWRSTRSARCWSARSFCVSSATRLGHRRAARWVAPGRCRSPPPTPG